MKTRKINISNFISQEEKDRIFSYSKYLAKCYNLCLDELKTNGDFSKIHPLTKQFQNENKHLYSKHCQNIGRDAVNAVKSFYKLRKVDKKARYPKNFRSYSSITLDANKQTYKNKTYLGGGFKFISDKCLKFTHPNFVLDLNRCKYFNPLEVNINTIKQIVISIVESQIYLNFVFDTKENQKAQLNKDFISIDLGISSIASIYSSKGECLKVKTKRFKGLEKVKDEIKSKRDKGLKRHSRRWNRLNEAAKKKQKKITNKRKDFLHKASKSIVKYCKQNQIDNIIVGDIETKKLTKKFRKGLNKSTQNEGLLGRFKSFISYKAKDEGLQVFMVNEAYTSQTNCLTGSRNLSSELSIRSVELLKDFVVDRDLNSAVNIAKKYGPLWSGHSFNKYSLLNVKEMLIEI